MSDRPGSPCKSARTAATDGSIGGRCPVASVSIRWRAAAARALAESPRNAHGFAGLLARKIDASTERREVAMSSTEAPAAGPDLAAGIPESDVPEGRMLAGQVGGDAVLLA